MTRVLFILSLILGSLSSSLGQNKITQSEFNSLVDYANSKYVMTFVNQKEKTNEVYFETYKKNIEPILKETSLNNLDKNINFEDLKSMFDNNTNAQGLVVEINNKRKDEYDENKTNEELIKIIVVSEWAKIDLKEISQQVQKQLEEKYLNTTTSNKKENRAEVDTSKNSNPNSKNNLVEINNDIRTLRIQIIFLFIFFVLLTIALIVVIIMLLKKNRDNKDKRKWEELNKSYNYLKTGNQKLVDKVNELSIRVNRAEKPLSSEQQNNNKHEVKPKHITKSTDFKGKASATEEIFFKTKNGKVLQEKLLSAQESAFKVYDINNNEAKFDYCGGVVNPDFFGGVCNFENNPAKIELIRNIETTTPGIVKKDNNGDWVVETPAIIKFV